MSEVTENYESSCGNASRDNNIKETRREIAQATTSAKRERQSHENVKKHCSRRLVMNNEDDSPQNCSRRVRLESETSNISHQAFSPENDEDHSCKQNSFQFCNGSKPNKCTQTQQASMQYRDNIFMQHAPHCANEKAITVHEELKGPETFVPPAGYVAPQLKRDDYMSGNSETFFSAFQNISNYTNEVTKNELRKDLLQDISQKLEVVKNIYNLALSNDSFTEAQRENIRKWKEEIDSSRTAHTADVKKEYDDGETANTNYSIKINQARHGNSQLSEKHFQGEIRNLHREKEALKCQFLGLQRGISEMQNSYRREINELNEKLECLRQDLQNSRRDILRLTQKSTDRGIDTKPANYCNNSSIDSSDLCVGSTVSSSREKTDRDVRFAALISTYLSIYPHGTCIDTICSYLQQMDPSVDPEELQNFMERFPALYRGEEASFDGTRRVKRWKFIGFHS